MALSQKIAEWIKQQVREANKEGVIVGLSGGIDSSCVAVLAKKALGPQVLGLLLPCGSSHEDEQFALAIAEKFAIETKKICLDEIFNGLVSLYPQGSAIAQANLKPRLRMITLYYFANTLNYLVAGTGNKSELSVGYFTKYGDGGVDILPLGGLYKREVRTLAKELAVPEEIITRAPSAGLWEDQTDEGEMGITYDELDRILAAMENRQTKSADKGNLLKVEKMVRVSEHKRTSTPIFRK